jgi:4'-phosphopantetheinyl transferase
LGAGQSCAVNQLNERTLGLYAAPGAEMALHADLIGIERHATNEVVAVLHLNLGEILWHPGQFYSGGQRGGQGRRKTLAESAVHIWTIDLAWQEDRMHELHKLLSADENERVERFVFDRDKRRFIAARGAMRKILSEYLSIPPQEVVFAYSRNGEPELASDWRETEIKFNLSHSSELAILAVARGLCVGVDLELINQGLAIDEIASRFFSPTEVNTLRAIPSERRQEAFFSCWTRKEAYIKALGAGLSLPLDSFDVAFGPGVPAALLRAGVAAEELPRWSIYDLAVAPMYAAALVVEGKKHKLQQRQWESHP